MSAVSEKSWSLAILELFTQVHPDGPSDKEIFKRDLIAFVKQINSFAIQKIELEPNELEKLAEEAWCSMTRSSQKIDALVTSGLFNVLVSVHENSLKEKDHIYYRDIIAKRQIQGWVNQKGIKLDFLLNNQKVLDWLCEAHETLQTAEERSLMRKTMKKIPDNFFSQTQKTKMDIGLEIQTRTTCEHLIKLLNGDNAEDLAANRLFYRYKNDYLSKAPTPEVAQACKSNLILTLSLRARQLPV